LPHLSSSQGPDASAARRGAGAARWIAPAILAAGLLATGVSTALTWQAAALRERLTFEHATEIELRTVEDQFRTYTALLRGAAGLFAAEDDTVTLAQFRAYVQRIELQRLYPGFLGIGFTPTLPASARETFAARAEALGVEKFRVRPPTDNPMISPVLFAEPPNPRNLAAIGYDVMSDPVRRDMVERARDTGRPAGVPGALDHVAPHRVGHHVVADGGEVARVRRLGEQDRADHRVVGGRPHPELLDAQRLGARGEGLPRRGGQGRREADAEEAGIEALQLDPLHVGPELGQRDGVVLGGEQAGGAAQEGRVGAELVLDGAQLDLGGVLEGQALAQRRRLPREGGADPGREQAGGQDRGRDPPRRARPPAGRARIRTLR